MPRVDIAGASEKGAKSQPAKAKNNGDDRTNLVKVIVAIGLFAAAGVGYYYMNKRPLSDGTPPVTAGDSPATPGAPAQQNRPELKLPDLPADQPTGGPRANPEYKPPK